MHMKRPEWTRVLSTIATLGLTAATLVQTPASLAANDVPGDSPAESPAVIVPDPATEPNEDPFIVVADRGVSAQEIKARAVALGVSVESLLEGVVE